MIQMIDTLVVPMSVNFHKCEVNDHNLYKEVTERKYIPINNLLYKFYLVIHYREN